MFETFPQLETNRLILRELTVADAQDIFQVYSNEDVIQFLGSPGYQSVVEVSHLISNLQADYRRGRAIDWGLVDKRQAAAIGKCRLRCWHRKHFQAEIGYVLARSYWGQGLMAEALSAIIEFGFETLGLHHFEARACLANFRSINLLKTLGFRQVSYPDNACLPRRKQDDIVRFFLQHEDWPETKTSKARNIDRTTQTIRQPADYRPKANRNMTITPWPNDYWLLKGELLMTPVIEAKKILAQLWAQKQAETTNLYALLDAARDPRISQALQALPENQYHCLFEGQLAQDLKTVAPYLVQLDDQPDFCRTIIEQGWGNSWGLFLATAATPEALLAHFRSLLMVRLESNPPQWLYFRYYDPRVLRVYLDHGDEAEHAFLFGPVQQYWLEAEASPELKLYANPGLNQAEDTSSFLATAEDIEMFSPYLADAFKERVLSDLQAFWPKQYKIMGEVAVRESIQRGIERARHYGLTTERDVFRFINLMYIFDLDFDSSGRYEWATKILTAETLDPRTKVNQLYERAKQVLASPVAE